MFYYLAYGLGIQSTLPLPELIAGEAAADVTIRLEDVEHPPSPPIPTEPGFWETEEGIYLCWQEVGTFLIRDGKEIIINPVPAVEEARLRLFLLGAVMSLLLHQRGLLVLHASAVAMHGGAVAFLGGKGYGKSTMAAALWARGHQLIADDVLALDCDDARGPMVRPAFPQLKLWPDAITSLGDDPETLPRVSSQYDKRDRQVGYRFLQNPCPLRRIYVLARDLAPLIDPLQPQDIIKRLIPHSYSARFGEQLLHSAAASRHLMQCMSLANKVPLYWLKRPPSLVDLPNLARMIEEEDIKG